MKNPKLLLAGLIFWGFFSGISALQSRWSVFVMGLIVFVIFGIKYIRSR